MKNLIILGSILFSFSMQAKITYPIVDTGQKRCFNNTKEIVFPWKNQVFYGQDAQYNGNQPKYKKNSNGTVSDLVTGLMWQYDPGSKKSFAQAVAGAKKCRTGGYRDWRLATIKELYSLIDFSGTDISPFSKTAKNPFIDTKYFKFNYGNTKTERIIDSQYATSTKYLSTTMGGNATMFGVNLADGRIKGYPSASWKKFYVIYVRGNPKYGKNKFRDNKNATISDEATGLMWMQIDSGKGMNWQQALKYAENFTYAGHSDWRLPNSKELQSIVDYKRCPDTHGTPAINPIFRLSTIRNKAGWVDFPFYWTSTTHKNQFGGSTADYISFGRALGWMKNRFTGKYTLMDVHGAGAQRSDPKAGKASLYPYGRGPQGDVIRIYNYVLLVRGGVAVPNKKGPKLATVSAPKTYYRSSSKSPFKQSSTGKRRR